MKVIVAGMSKTGTKTMNAALSMLGYKVYDFIENSYYLGDDWAKIFSQGWTTADFKRMYDDVDAIVDVPALYFWEEIHKAFPDAKIILTVREDEDIWFKSMERQSDAEDRNIIFRLLALLSPSQRKMIEEIGYPIGTVVFGMPKISMFRRKKHLNEQLFKLKYRAHNAYVLQNAPADKLLVFKCKEGWEPLCKFLEKPIPGEPFPHKNVRGNVIEEELKNHPMFHQMKKEMLRSLGLSVVAIAAGLCCTYIGPTKLITGMTEKLRLLWPK